MPALLLIIYGLFGACLIGSAIKQPMQKPPTWIVKQQKQWEPLNPALSNNDWNKLGGIKK